MRCRCKRKSAAAATLKDRSLISLPLKLHARRSAQMTVLTVLKRFEFEPQLLRSGVIVMDSAGPSNEMVFFVRGAPASIEELMPRTSMLQDLHQV